MESRKRFIVPESSDVTWDIDLEIIVKSSIICALRAKVIVQVAGPTKSLHPIITTLFVLCQSLLKWRLPEWEQ